MKAEHLVDIVIPGWGNFELTERLLASLAAYSPRELYEVIYVDDGSEPPPASLGKDDLWPAEWGARSHWLNEHRGFVATANAGLRLVRHEPAPYILLLNNDVEIPAGDGTWLERLLAPFADPAVGAVGAVSDHVYGSQRRARAGAREVEAKVLIGFALALRKAALWGGDGEREGVGLFDERFGWGNYEDWDLSLRLRQAGWRLLVAESVWLHHRMHQTFRRLEQEGVDFQALLEGNLQKLIDKWTVEGLRALGVVVLPR